MLRHFGQDRNPMLEFLQVRFLILLVLVSLAVPAEARRPPSGDVQRPHHVASEVLMRQRALRKLRERQIPGVRRVAANNSANQDFGNIAVMQDDGTLFSQVNPFNLASQSVLFTLGSSGTYTVSNITPQFDMASATAGQALTLADDDTHQVVLPFPFTFYGKTYSAIFLNSDGNLTFNVGDASSDSRDLGRALVGAPRLMPFFQDLNPAEGGTVTANVQGGKATFSWLAVPLCCTEDLQPPVAQQTFQVILYQNGNIQYNYGIVQSQVAVVGISPGGTGLTPPAAVEVIFTTPAGAAASSAALVEVYDTAIHLCISCVGLHFYATHEDAYDTLMTFTSTGYTFSLNNGEGIFAETNPIKNQITGIGGFQPQTYDYSHDAGSSRVQTIIEMGWLGKYGTDPNTAVDAVGNSTSFTVMSHEIGHRWLAYALFPDAADSQSGDLLDTPQAHWSFLYNDDASFMLGDRIQDNGAQVNGSHSFQTVANTLQYSALDQYLMGLTPASSVPDSFMVANPTPTSLTQNTYPYNTTFTGTRVPVTLSQITQANGPRLPPSTMAPKNYNVAIVYILAQGQTLSPGDVNVAKLQNFQAAYDSYWNAATAGLATMHTELVKAARIAPSPVAAGSVTTTVQASINLQTAAPAGGATFQLVSSDPTIVKVPASVTVAAGAPQAAFTMVMGVVGNATVTATSPGYETTVAAVASTNGAAVNNATFAAGYAMSPGAIGAFFGPSLTPTTSSASAVPLPTILGAVTAKVNGTLVPLFYASPGQLNFQVPFEAAGSYTNLAVTSSTGQTLTVPLLLNAASPGIFTTLSNGSGPAAALHGVSGLPITPTSPAQQGEVISLFTTGLGAVYPTVSSGTAAPAAPLSLVTSAVTATIGGQSAAVSFAGLAPTFVGLYQVNVQIPSGTTGASVPIVISVSGFSSNTATLPIQ
jgi:uncharacterized protein (TIGR03437 family)